MTALDPNFRDLLNCFNSSGVRYLVVGGYAVNYHGYHRNTKDIDVWIAVSPDNAERISKALRVFGFGPGGAPPADFLELGVVRSFGREPLRVDILTAPTGVEFDACWERRVEADVDGTRFPVISLDDLLTNKRASARTKDVADVEGLNPPPARVQKPRRARKKN